MVRMGTMAMILIRVMIILDRVTMMVGRVGMMMEVKVLMSWKLGR